MKNKSKAISILTIFCLCSVVLIPIGIALMWFFTNWKTKPRIILSAITATIFIGVIVLLLLLEPSYNTSGISLPFGHTSGYTEFDASSTSKKESSSKDKKNKRRTSKKTDSEFNQEEDPELIAPSIKKQSGKKIGRWIYSFLFMLFMLFLVIWQSLKSSKKSEAYENPYVDTTLYKIPLPDDTKFPMVHYLKLQLRQSEKLLYATETNQKDNEGDLVVTNMRVVIFSKQENMDFPLKLIDSVVSTTNSVMLLNSEDKKHYVFLPENQMKYALATIRWAMKKNNG